MPPLAPSQTTPPKPKAQPAPKTVIQGWSISNQRAGISGEVGTNQLSLRSTGLSGIHWTPIVAPPGSSIENEGPKVDQLASSAAHYCSLRVYDRRSLR